MGYNTPKQTVSQFQLKGRYARQYLSFEMELAFNCKPQQWSVDGQRTIRLDGRSTLKNPFAFPAQPIFKIYGDSGGELYVGEEKITIHSIKDYVLLNCETHNAYKRKSRKMSCKPFSELVYILIAGTYLPHVCKAWGSLKLLERVSY